MKYTKLSFSYGKVNYYPTNFTNSYFKDTLYETVASPIMYVDTDKLEAGKEKFKKDLLKYYNNIITIIEKYDSKRNNNGG